MTAENQVTITIDNRVIEAAVFNNSTAADFISQLPLTITFDDFNGVEKIGYLPTELTMQGMPEGDNPAIGDLGYYEPGGNLVLYYGDVGYWKGIARIGRIQGDLSVIANQPDGFTATIALVN